MNMGLLTEHDMNVGDHTETTEVLLTLLSQNKALEGTSTNFILQVKPTPNPPPNFPSYKILDNPMVF